MKRRNALGVLLLPASGPLLASGCALSPRARPLPTGVRTLVTAGRDLGESGEADEAFAARELEHIAERVRQARAASHGVSSAHAHASALNRVIYDELGFTREVDDTALDFVLLPGVLRTRRGSCVGLGCLYLAASELVGFTGSGVLLPGHFFVRLGEEGRWRNVELLRRGEELPDAWYQERYPVGRPVRAYARALTLQEVLGVIDFNIGNERRRQGRLLGARRAYERSTQHFPGFAEAHASLGAVAHLLGDLEAAAAAYRAAERQNPELAGLSENIELLSRERRRN